MRSPTVDVHGNVVYPDMRPRWFVLPPSHPFLRWQRRRGSYVGRHVCMLTLFGPFATEAEAQAVAAEWARTAEP